MYVHHSQNIYLFIFIFILTPSVAFPIFSHLKVVSLFTLSAPEQTLDSDVYSRSPH